MTRVRAIWTELVERKLWPVAAALVVALVAVPVLLAVTDAKLRVVSVGAPRELSVTLSLTGYIASGPSTGAPPNQPEPPRRPGA